MVLEVIKVPRKDAPPDKPINFPPLENLHLELLENKKKLKKSLPLIPLSNKKIKPKPLPPPENFDAPKKQKEDDDLVNDLTEDEKPSNPKEKEKTKTSEDEEMLAGLKDSSTEAEVEEEIGDIKEEEQNQEEVEEEHVEEEEAYAEVEEDPYAGMSPEEREAAEKEEYLWRWRILKMKYPGKDVNTWNEHSDLEMMKTSYRRTLKELQLEDNVESYRTYLIVGFMAMEYIGTSWLGIDLGGFTIQQTSMMHKYETLLIELGERPYSSWTSNLPVEARIIGLILVQAGMFYLAKVISNKFGSSVADIFKGITGQPSASAPEKSSGQKPSSKKKRMRGPKISADEIRKMAGD